ncbi:MAG: M50 family metallopeptidase [Acidimicrobiales bacterium]
MTQTESIHPSPADSHDQPAPEPDARAGWARLVPLVGTMVFGIALSLAKGTFPVVAFIIGIILMVMIHEGGHFVAAKLSGMKVTQFFFGFGPRLWSVRRGETEYGVKAIPAGGYVKIVGMSNMERDIDPADEPRTYRQQSYPRRMLVAVAGVFTHFVVGFVLLLVLWTVVGVPSYDRPSLSVGSISKLESGASPATDAGFQIGDRILSVEGRPVKGWDDVPPLIRARAGMPTRFELERDGRRLGVTAVPAEVERERAKVGFIGIGPAPTVERVGPIAGAGRAVTDLARLSTGAVKAIGTFFTPGALTNYAGQVTQGARGEPSNERFMSVVGVVRIAGQAADSGSFFLVYLLVVLNVFVAVFNLVPLLPLDGGHMAIATYERIRSRRDRPYHADISKLVPVAAAVVAIMLVIGVTSLYLDIVKPVANPFQ